MCTCTSFKTYAVLQIVPSRIIMRFCDIFSRCKFSMFNVYPCSLLDVLTEMLVLRISFRN